MRLSVGVEHFDWTEVRNRRNRLLADTDRYLLPDFPVSQEDRSAIMAYRQALRDALNGVQRPEHVVLPDVPLCLAGKVG